MLNGKRILLVDDSLTIRKFLRNVLLRASAEEVEEASNSREALALIESGKQYDLVLLDLMLPDIDGMQVWPGIPPGQLPVLFTKYHRMPGQLTRNVKGAGLGLW